MAEIICGAYYSDTADFKYCDISAFWNTYKENIAAEKKQAVGDFGMIIDQIYGEMQQSQLNDKDVKNIIQKYTNYYKQQKIELGLWQGEKKKKIYYSDKAHFNTKKTALKTIRL